MIESVRLSNFEIHKNTLLKFSDGVNFITGSSDNGKSSVIKALGWVIRNRPTGTAFVNRSALEAQVTVVTSPGRSRVVRAVELTKKSRTTKLNQYRLNRESFKALGSSVPDAISKAINMEEVNVQSQFDQFFLLQDSPGQVAQKFNKVMGLDVIDEALRAVNAVVNKANQEAEYQATEILQTEETLDQFADLENIKILVESANLLDDRLRTIKQNKNNLEKVLLNYHTTVNRIEVEKEKTKGGEEVKLLLQKARDHKSKTQKLETLRQYLENYTATNTTKKGNLSWLKIETGYNKTGNIVKSLEDVQYRQRSLKKHITTRTTFYKNVEAAKIDLEEKQKKMTIWKENNPVCPVCGGKWE